MPKTDKKGWVIAASVCSGYRIKADIFQFCHQNGFGEAEKVLRRFVTDPAFPKD